MELLQSSALPLGYVAEIAWSGYRESNSDVQLGKLTGYHYITPARGDCLRFPTVAKASCAGAGLPGE